MNIQKENWMRQHGIRRFKKPMSYVSKSGFLYTKTYIERTPLPLLIYHDHQLLAGEISVTTQHVKTSIQEQNEKQKWLKAHRIYQLEKPIQYYTSKNRFYTAHYIEKTDLLDLEDRFFRVLTHAGKQMIIDDEIVEMTLL